MLKRHKASKINKKKKGQSTVEYIILFAAVIAALIIFLRPGGVFQQAFNSSLNATTNAMEDMGNRLATSRPVAP